MERDEYEFMFRAEDHHWWYHGMRAITLGLLDRYVGRGRDLAVLDAGCGTGACMQYLAPFGRVTGVDMAPEALSFCQQRGLRRLGRASIAELPFAADSFDLVTSFDVLSECGLSYEAAVLGEFWRVLRPGGHLLLRLPAYEWLRGRHDELVHTRHRYTRGEIVSRLRERGFQIERSSYANCFLFPLAALKRLKDRLLPPAQAGSDVTVSGGWSNGVLARVFAAEAPLVRRLRLPFGLTAIVLARKPR